MVPWGVSLLLFKHLGICGFYVGFGGSFARVVSELWVFEEEGMDVVLRM